MSILLERARSWRRRRGLAVLREGAGRLLCRSLAALTAVLWLDAAVLLPHAARFWCWISGIAGLSAGVYFMLWRPWRRNRWETVLQEAAEKFPQLRDFLLPAWELREATPAHTSRELAQAHLAATEELLKALPDGPAFFPRPSRQLRRAGAGALFCLLTWPWLGAVTWQRVLSPWRDVPLERFVEVQPADAVWRLGEPATISVHGRGLAGGPRHPADTKLWIQTSGPWRAVAWDRSMPDAVVFTVASVAEPMRYRVTWRSLESRVYRLRPEPAPQLESLRAKLAGQSEAVALSGADPLTARQGVWLVISGRPNQTLAKASLRASFLPAPLELKCSANGNYNVGFFARQDGVFQFDLETPDGRRDPAPVVYTLKAAVDLPPTAELLSPLQPVQASPEDVLPVAYAARDDSGITRVTLLVGMPGRPEQEFPLQAFRRDFPRNLISDYPWELAGLPVGAKISFRLKAYDDAAAPQSGVSQPGQVEIVDFEAGHRAARQRWQKAEELLGRLAQREELVRDRYASGDAAGARRELPALPEAWKETEAAMAQLARAMDDDAYANPGLNEQFSELASELERGARQDLAAALDADQRDDTAAARDRHGRLARTARQAENALKKGRELQDLQDFYMQAGRMSQDGERLAASLEAMSGGQKGQLPPQLLQRIQDTLKRIQERMADLQKAVAALPQAAAGGAEEAARRSYAMPLLQAQTSADALQSALRAGDLAMAASIAKELARQLAEIESAITAAASAGADAAVQRQGSARLQRLQKLWPEVVEEQTRLVDAGQGLEESRRGRMLAAQKELLAALAAEESALISSAAAVGAQFPAGALSAMRSLRDELASGKAGRALNLAGTAAGLLRVAAQGQAAGSESSRTLSWFASAQADIGQRLAQTPSSLPSEGPRPETSAAARRQAEVRGKTAQLERELQSLEDEMPPLGAMAELEAAQGEQQSAEGDLDRGDSAAALGHQEKALELLEQGGRDFERAAAARQRMEMAVSSGFSRSASGARPAPGGGGGGARVGFVGLPTAKDYQPPKEIREELERSLREKRPAAYDGVIKEYFKRISQ